MHHPLPHHYYVRPHPLFLATDEQPLAKNTSIYTILQFLSIFLKFFDFLFLSALGIREPPLGFSNRLLHSF